MSSSSNCILSVVVPVYNRASLIVRTLDSIAAQDYRPFRLIIVDNNSTDDTLSTIHEWVSGHEDNQLDIRILSEKQPGAAAARQRGVDEVDTPWVMHFDSDDTMRTGHISRVINGIAANPMADIVGWDVLTHQLDGSTKVNRFHAHNAMVNHLFHATLSSVRYAVKTELLRKCGGWERDIHGWDDYVLGVKLLLPNPILAKLGNDISVDMYSQEQSVSGNSFSEKAGEWEFALSRCEQIIRQANRLELLKWIDARRAILAGHYHAEGNELGNKQLKSMSQGISQYRRWAFRRIFAHVAHHRRGTAMLCRLLLTYVK